MTNHDSPLFERPNRQDLIDTCLICGTLTETSAWYGVTPRTVGRWLSYYENPIEWKTGRPGLNDKPRARLKNA